MYSLNSNKYIIVIYKQILQEYSWPWRQLWFARRQSQKSDSLCSQIPPLGKWMKIVAIGISWLVPPHFCLLEEKKRPRNMRGLTKKKKKRINMSLICFKNDINSHWPKTETWMPWDADLGRSCGSAHLCSNGAGFRKVHTGDGYY